MKEGERKLVVTFLGDAKYGRTVHSLSKLLGGFVPLYAYSAYLTIAETKASLPGRE